MSAQPRVTVVTSVYNLVRYLPEAIESLQQQTYDRWELVIVDDGSTAPEAVELLDRYERDGHTVIRTENRGAGAARNTGLAHGSGEYILALDSDDRLAPAFLERTVAALDTTPEAGLAATGYRMFGAVRGKRIPPDYDLVTILCSNVIGPSALTRRICWEEAGGYPERATDDFEGGEDWSLLLSIAGRGWTWTVVPEYLFHYRVRRDSKSATNREPERRRKVISRQVLRHEALYRENVVGVFTEMELRVRRLQTTGPTVPLRRLLRRL